MGEMARFEESPVSEPSRPSMMMVETKPDDVARSMEGEIVTVITVSDPMAFELDFCPIFLIAK